MSYNFLKPFTFQSGVKIKNRVVIPPMTESMSFPDGFVTQDELKYFQIHTGGAGIFVTPVANVNALGKGFEGELSIENNRFIPGLTELATTIKQNGTKAILQIFSAGRMTNSQILRGKQPVSASAVAALRPNAETPRALTSEEVEATIQDFKDATTRAIKAGFDGVEIHGANTYLIQQFFSPHSNRRTDKWGGSLEKRMAFPLAVINAVQEAATEAERPDFIIGYRISPEEIEKPGITIEDTLELVKKLDQMSLDYLHISMGNAWRTSLNNKDDQETLLSKFQKTIQQTPIISVGGVERPEDAEKVINAGADFVAIGRESLREPAWVQKVENHAEDTIRYTISTTDLSELGIAEPFFQYLLGMERRGANVGFVPKLDQTTNDAASNVIFK